MNKRDIVESLSCPDTQQPTLDESPPIQQLPIETKINSPLPPENQTKRLKLQLRTVTERGGVYYKNLAHEALGSSARTVVTDIDLKRIDDLMEQVTNELAHGNRALLPPIDSNL